MATPMLWSIGFLVTFLFGGLTGVILSSPVLDFQVSDTYFVVAHFHYVVFGTVVFAMFAGFYFWWPKFTGKMLNERLGKVHFWMLFLGFHLTFFVQHLLGACRNAAGATPTTCPRTASRSSTRFPLRALSCSHRRPCRSCGTCTERRSTHPRSRKTTRGATPTPWNGPPVARRPATTSCPSRVSARSGPRSTFTTPR